MYIFSNCKIINIISCLFHINFKNSLVHRKHDYFYMLGHNTWDRHPSVLDFMIKLSQKWNPVKIWDRIDTCRKSPQTALMRLKPRFCVPAIEPNQDRFLNVHSSRLYKFWRGSPLAASRI